MKKNNEQAEILQITFRRVIYLLWLIMLGAALFFVANQFFFVEEGYVAVVTRWGKITGQENYLIPPGGPHFAWPRPIEQVAFYPTTMQNVVLDRAFCALNERASSLVPGVDGSLLTGDKNLVHGEWSLDYFIDTANLQDFMAHTGNLQQAEKILKSVLAQAVIHTVSHMTVDDFIKGNIDNEEIKIQVQKVLDRLHSGLKVCHVTSTRYAVPAALREVFLAVNRSESEKALQIEQAKRYRESWLNSISGKRWPEVLGAIEDFERNGNDAQLKRALASSYSLGKVAGILDEARIYRTATVQEIKSEAERFQKLLQEKRKNPEILHNRLLQDALQEIFAGNVKKYYFPQNQEKTIYLELL